MGQKRDLTDSEKAKLARCLAEGCSSLEIAKLLKRDHRTIKRFMENSQEGRKKRVEKKRRKITTYELKKIKLEAAKMPLATSLTIFQSCNVTGVSKSTRCAILRDMAKNNKGQKQVVAKCKGKCPKKQNVFHVANTKSVKDKNKAKSVLSNLKKIIAANSDKVSKINKAFTELHKDVVQTKKMAAVPKETQVSRPTPEASPNIDTATDLFSQL